MGLIQSVHTQPEAINNLQYAEQACLPITHVPLSAALIYAHTHWTAHMHAHKCSQTHSGHTAHIHSAAASSSYLDAENY